MADVFFIVCDGLKGLPDSVSTVLSHAIVQACIIRLIRGTSRYASKRCWEQLARDLRPIYSAATRRRRGRRSKRKRSAIQVLTRS